MENDKESATANGSESAVANANESTVANGNGEPIDPWRMAELCCWFVVVLAPILTWVNGPSVSTDQFVVRTFVFCAALTGGIVLSVANFVRWRRKKRA
jgi:hypothetical protein